MGRRIVAVHLNKFSDGRGGWTFNPEFVLDNGRKLRFVAHELECGDGYGIDPLLTDAVVEGQKGQTK